jgi:hypothetical protein
MHRNDVSGLNVCSASVFRAALGIACTVIFAGTASAADPAPVTLLYNAHIFTADVAHPYADALAIRGGTILAVGELSAVEKAAGYGEQSRHAG